jgi:hypothetical protein
MKPPDFTLKVENADNHLSLADVSAKEVAQLITSITDIIEAANPTADGEPFGVSLSSVSEQSIYTGLNLTERCRVGTAVLMAAISTGDFSSVPPLAHKKLVAFSRQLIGQGRIATLRGAGVPDVEISATKPIPEVKPKLVKHQTTLYAKVVGAGGIRTHRATLVLSNPTRTLEVDVESPDLVKQLAARMYEVVGVRGTAWTDLRTETLESFKVEGLTRYRGGDADPIAALNKIAADFPEAWAGVDVSSVISELRDGEGG